MDAVTDFEEARFEETLSPKERASPNYLDWPNETIGRLVKHLAAGIYQDARERASNEELKGMLWEEACAYLLVSSALNIHSVSTKIEITDLTIKGKHVGDWSVSIRRTDAH